MSVTDDDWGKGLNLFTICDLSKRGNTCLDHTESPVLSLWRGKVSKNRQSNTKAVVCGLFCFNSTWKWAPTLL